MNLALFITKGNIADVESFCAESSKLQHELVNGCLTVVHQKQIDPKRIAAVVSPLAEKFKVKVAIPVVANLSHGELPQLALLFSRFVIAAYTRYPGAWLLMDQLAMPTVENWMQAASKQHNSIRANISGRGLRAKGSLVPVGPIIISLPFKHLRFLTAVTSEGWRSRGQYFFARCGFAQIPEEEWLFRMGKIQEAPSTRQVASTQVVDPAIPDVVQPVVDEPTSIPAQHEVDQASIALTKTDLLDEVEKLTGTRPHHFTSETKLRSILEQIAATA